jgi:hypothetical protein
VCRRTFAIETYSAAACLHAGRPRRPRSPSEVPRRFFPPRPRPFRARTFSVFLGDVRCREPVRWAAVLLASIISSFPAPIFLGDQGTDNRPKTTVHDCTVVVFFFLFWESCCTWTLHVSRVKISFIILLLGP